MNQPTSLLQKGLLMTSDMQPKMLCDYACACGENPYWHPLEKMFYWTDIPAGKLYRYNPADGSHEMCYQGRIVGGFTVQPDGALLLFMDQGTVALWHNGQITRTLIGELPEEKTTRFNDVIADPEGRVFCGTMPTKDRPGRLYRLDRDGSIHKLLEGIGCSNGMGFSPDRKTMYYTDTPKHEIYAFDYDQTTGNISRQRVLIKTEDGGGGPDGMTVDAAGDIWSTRWDGSCVVRYGPDGTEKQRIKFPVKKVSSVTFGDDDCASMYFTTAGGNNKKDNGEQAGAIFRLRLPGVKGVTEFYSRIGG